MKQKLKCFTALILALSMCIGSIQVNAFAAEQNGLPQATEPMNNQQDDYATNTYSAESSDNDTRLALSADLSGKSADFVFIIDSTDSMSSYINKVKSNVQAFVQELNMSGLDLRVAVIDYKDILVDGLDSTTVHTSGKSRWTSDFEKVTEMLSEITVRGGGDHLETPTEALMKIASIDWNWRENTDRFAFVLTDTGYKENSYIPSMESTISALKNFDIKVSVVTPIFYHKNYEKLCTQTSGNLIDISTSDYYTLMMEVASWISDTTIAQKPVTHVGELQSISTPPLCTVTIDGMTYDVTDSCDQAVIVDIWINAGEKPCKVIYNLLDGKVDKINLLEDCTNLKVSAITSDPASIDYENGRFTTDKIQLSMKLTCIVTGGYRPTEEDKISILVDDLSVSVNEYSGLYLEKKLFKKIFTKKEEVFSVTYGSPVIKTFDVHIDGSAPEDLTEWKQINIRINGEDRIHNFEINNLQKQQEAAAEKEKQKEKNAASAALIQQLKNRTTVTLPPVVQYYLSNSQQDEVEDFLSIFVAEMFMGSEVEAESSWIDDIVDGLTERVKDQIVDAYFKHIGISSPEIRLGKANYRVPVQIQADNKDGKQIKLDFVLDINAQYMNEKVYGAYISISCTIPQKYQKEDAIDIGSQGIITYVDLGSFVDGVKDYSKAAYMEIWGNDVDKLIESIFGDPLKDITGGVFSFTGFFGADCAYQVSTKFGEKYLNEKKNTSKSVNIKVNGNDSRSFKAYTSYDSVAPYQEDDIPIPINLRIYDSQNKLCGTLKKGVVDSCAPGVFIHAEPNDICIRLVSDDYMIQLEGTDDIQVDWNVREYMDGEKIREVKTSNVPLKKDVSYEAYIPDSLFINSKMYRLTSANGDKLEITDEVLSKCLGRHEYKYIVQEDGTRTAVCANCGYSYTTENTTDLDKKEDIRITLDADGGICSKDYVLVSYGQSYGELPVAKKDGYTFNGWYTEKNGNGQKAETVISVTEDHSLYAYWTTLRSYVITYDLGNGNVSGNPDSYTPGIEDIRIVAPSKKGYTFIGWTGSNGPIPQITVTIRKETNGNLHYQANWTPIEYNITYSLGENAYAYNPDSYNIESAAFSLQQPTRQGYTFLGWTGSNGMVPDQNVLIPSGTTGDLYYTANWEKNSIPISNATVTGIRSSYTYTGKKLFPVPILTVNGKKLIKGFDFEISYQTNKKVGEAKVLINGKNQYYGTKTITFKIRPKKTVICKLKNSKKMLTIKWKKQTTQTDGYEIQYTQNKKFKKKTIQQLMDKTSTLMKVKKNNANKKYYVRIRTYKIVSGKFYFSKWSKIKSTH